MSEGINYIYNIDGVILFNPKENTLKNIENEKEAALYITCSRCLFILLSNGDGIVSQSDILEFSWPENHRTISYNTFYQCVLNLRKAFHQIDYHKKIIITFPKKGLSIANNVIVSKVESCNADEIEKNFNADEKNNDEPSINTGSLEARGNFKLYIIMLMLISFSSIMAISAYGYLNNGFFSTYTEIPISKNQCHIYVNEDNTNIIKSEAFIKHEKEICSDNRHIYLTLYENTKRVSAISCKNKVDYFSTNSCVSYYYPTYGGAE